MRLYCLVYVIYCTLLRVSAQNLTDLRDVLNIWQPRYISEDEWANYRVVQKCQNEMRMFVDALIEYKIWALQMLDASGRPSGKLFHGDRLWLGSRVQCEEVSLNTNVTVNPVFRVVHFSTGLDKLFMLKFDDISLGLCLPEACGSPTDVRDLINIMVKPKKNILHNFKVEKVKVLPPNISIFDDPVFLVMTFVCSIFLILMITATVVDIFLMSSFQDSEFLIETKTRLMIEALLSFSVRRNVSRFFSDGLSGQEGSLVVVHGLRVISFSWVITCHTCLCILHFADNPSFRATAERDFLMQMLTSGTFSVDTFFFLSGLLISYVFLRIETETKNIKEKTSDFMKFIWICVYRFVRLTPPYAFVIALVIVTMRQYVNSSVFEAPNLDLHDNCELYWWRNLLYVNTFYPGQQMCMSWSWYLSIDSQLYVIATALLVLFLRRPRTACVLSLSLLLSSWVISAAISVKYALTLRLDQPFALYDFLYDKPWTRIGPYIVGMATGWILVNKKCQFKMNKFAVLTGWTLSLLTMFMLVHALHGGWMGTAGSAIYVALSHSLWGLCVAWTLVACTAGYGGWITKFLGHKLMIPFSRGTYCGYLIHSAVIQWVFLNMDSSITMSRDIVAMLFIGFFMSSYLLGVFISLAFEAPFTSLLSLARKVASPPGKLSNKNDTC